MAAKNEDDFDVLKFFIAVMILLTAFVGGYALYLRGQVSTLTMQIKGQVRMLVEMKQMAGEPQFREFVARDRENRMPANGQTPTDFKALLVTDVPKFGIVYTQLTQDGAIDHRVATEIPFSMVIDSCRVEDLTKFFAHVEEKWPGAKAREVRQLEWDEKRMTWKATIVLSIFRATTN
jgi:hypothetical protein